MAKPREYDREEVLERAMEIFWQRGYTATGIGDLERAMGINRSSLYHAFGDKEGLFLEVLSHYEKVVVNDLLAELERSEDGMPSIKRFFERVLTYQTSATPRRGCLMNSTANELAQHVGRIGEKVSAHLGRFEEGYFKALTRARDQGETRSDLGLRDQARLLTAVTQGLLVMAKTSPEPKVLRSVVRSALASVER